MTDFHAMAQQCAPTVAPQTMAAIVKTESGYNPFAIGVVGGRLQRQPRTLQEAVDTAEALAAGGWNFSVGLAQVNRYNLPKSWPGYAKAFDQCSNLALGSKILTDCFNKAEVKSSSPQQSLQAAMSCYYSGNFTRGFKEEAGKPSYVQRVMNNAISLEQTRTMRLAVPQPGAAGPGETNKRTGEIKLAPSGKNTAEAPLRPQATTGHKSNPASDSSHLNTKPSLAEENPQAGVVVF